MGPEGTGDLGPKSVRHRVGLVPSGLLGRSLRKVISRLGLLIITSRLGPCDDDESCSPRLIGSLAAATPEDLDSWVEFFWRDAGSAGDSKV